MNNDISTNGSKQNPAIKILLIFIILLFVSVGSYSLYKVFIKKPSTNENLTPTNMSPTVTEIAENLVLTPFQSPTPQISITAVISKIPTITPNKNISPIPATTTPSKVPSTTPILRPTSTPIPTITALYTTTISPSPTPVRFLPDAGFSTPTILLIILGVVLILPVISVL